MKWILDKQLRSYLGSWVYTILIFIVIGFLAYKEIPPVNKDLITTIIGMLVASLTVVVYTLIGKDPEAEAIIKAENLSLKNQTAQMIERVNHLEKMLMALQQMIIQDLSVTSGVKAHVVSKVLNTEK